jgi:hypothetical protein
MFQEYHELIDSDIADMANIANRKEAHSGLSPAGAIVGAMFNGPFIGEFVLSTWAFEAEQRSPTALDHFDTEKLFPSKESG